MTATRRSVYVSFVAAVFVGFMLVSVARVFPRTEPGLLRFDTDVTPPKSETRLSLIYVGSPDCSWSTRSEVMGAVRTIGDRLRGYALENGMGFTTLGVATTADARDGFRHLDAVADFDVVSVGEHTANAITLDYFWGAGLPPSTPQVLVLRREITWADRGALPGEFTGSVVRRLGRASGAATLLAWASSPKVLPPSSARLNGSAF